MLAVFTTIGEMASMYVISPQSQMFLFFYCITTELNNGSAPTSGGQYYWVSMLAPPYCRKFLSYITGKICFSEVQCVFVDVL